jgi:uncharacterized protein
MINERYAPDFRVSIDGAAIPRALRSSVTSVSYQTGLEGADRVELTLVNPDLRWLDHPLLATRRALKLELGYAPNSLEQLFVGEIVGQSATFPSGGVPTLTVVAQDRRQRMQRGSKTRWFAIPGQASNRPLPDALVVGSVSAESELLAVLDPLSSALSVLIGRAEEIAAAGSSDPQQIQKVIRRQLGESDYQFLTRIAKQNDWHMLIDHREPLGGYKLRFLSPAEHRTPALQLTYGRSLLDFAPRISEVGQVLAVSVPVWVAAIKMEFLVTVAWDWDRQSLDLTVTPSSGAQSGLDVLPDVYAAMKNKAKSGAERQAISQSESRAAAEQKQREEKPAVMLIEEAVTETTAARVIVSKLIPKLNQRLTGAGNTVGDPRIRAGIVIELEGLGRQFSGRYRVTSASHTLDSGGYRTRFEVRREIWLGGIPSTEPSRARSP